MNGRKKEESNKAARNYFFVSRDFASPSSGVTFKEATLLMALVMKKVVIWVKIGDERLPNYIMIMS